jgi:hypothetical protein
MAPDGFAPFDADGPIGDLLDSTQPLLAWAVALEAIEKRARRLAHVVGHPVAPDGPQRGVEAVEGGYRRSYSNGTFYLRGTTGTPYWLDEPTALRYDLRGNTRSYLGFPVADLEVDPADPTMGLTRFEHGAIFFFPDLGTIDVQHVAVTFEGFHCFGETDESSAHDEPYFTFGVVPMNTEARTVVQSRIFTDVDGGESVAERVELYTGPPWGVALSVSLVEHDHSDPEHFKGKVDQAVDKAAEKAIEALGAIPVVGPALSVVADVAFLIGGDDLKQELNELLGTEDDHIGTATITLPTKELLRLSQTPARPFEGVLAHVETPVLARDGASYRAYLKVEAVTP